MISSLTHTNLSALPHVGHAFFTRTGGVSQGLHASLSVKTKDGQEDASARNMVLAARHIGVEDHHLVLPLQIHSAFVKEIKDPFPFQPTDARPQVDGLWTTRPGLGLGVNTADCVPLLIAHKERPLVASLHAGWKGALAGIVETMIEALTAQGAQPQDLVVGIGPAIAQECYEVGQEVRSAFTAKHAEAHIFFQDNPDKTDHYFFDLPGFVAARLRAYGVEDIAPSLWNTYAEEERFFSCRRAFHRQESDFGCQLSAIWLRGAPHHVS